MKRTLVAAILLAVLALPSTALPAATETIGVVRSSVGAASVVRTGQVLPAARGTKLCVGDVLETGPDGSVGVVLRDDSTLSLGPSSRLVLKEFLYSPAEGKLGLLARLSRGTMAYISGLIGKLAPEKARFETPVATIGIRGTRFAVRTGDHPAE